MEYKAGQGIGIPSLYSEVIYWVRKGQEREQMWSERKTTENDIKWAHFTLKSQFFAAEYTVITNIPRIYCLLFLPLDTVFRTIHDGLVLLYIKEQQGSW